MAKRISDKQKKEIIEDFISNKTLEEISEKYNFTKLTITRNLKKNLGDEKFYELINNSKSDKEIVNNKSLLNQYPENSEEFSEISSHEKISENSFLEIAPLDYEINNLTRKDLSSVSITEVNLPKVVFMVVDKQIELKPKLLKEYVEWNFLSEKDLNRKTIEIYFDLKIAKRSCSKEQKVIKVPNSDVFRIAAPILISKGISRIVSTDLLIAL